MMQVGCWPWQPKRMVSLPVLDPLAILVQLQLRFREVKHWSDSMYSGVRPRHECAFSWAHARLNARFALTLALTLSSLVAQASGPWSAGR
jgi:hypothetical protein